MREFGFFLQEAWSSLRRNLASSLAAVTAIAAVLFLLLLLMLISHNILVLADNLSERKGLSVFLANEVEAERVAELQHHFTGFREVSEARLVSRAEALRDLEDELGTPGIVAALGENPLPDVLLITPHEEHSSAEILTRLAREMEAYAGVEDVLYGERWVEVLDRGLRIVRRANAITGVLAVLAIVLVLGNTLRLIVLMREEPLTIMKMIGATDTFIRVPFVLAGVMLCMLGAMAALLLLYAGNAAGGMFLPGLRFLPPVSILLFITGVALVGMAGSLLTVEVSLRQLERHGSGAAW